MITREHTKKIKIGNVTIGGGMPVAIQSMTNTRTADIAATTAQIQRLEDVGCEIIRVAVPDMESALAIDKIKEKIDIPLVCDIHFDYKLALACMERGADKIRINPGNIGSEERVRQVAQMSLKKNIPIRIGVNGGSLDKNILQKFGKPSPEAILQSASEHIELLNRYGMDNLVVSLKSSNVPQTIRAVQLFAQKYDYPLHLGVTEAGTPYSGSIKSAVGIGSMLLSGIGDTIRVSLTGSPEPEVAAAILILKAAGLRPQGAEVISCPTCGRCGVNLFKVATEIENQVSKLSLPIKIAVMGCTVNGPGEAREADIGVACGIGEGLIFKKGEIFKKVAECDIVAAMMEEINKMKA